MNVAGSLFAIGTWLTGTVWGTHCLLDAAHEDDDALSWCKENGIPLFVPCMVGALCVWPWLGYWEVRYVFLLARRRVRRWLHVRRFRRSIKRLARETVDEMVAEYDARLAEAIQRNVDERVVAAMRGAK